LAVVFFDLAWRSLPGYPGHRVIDVLSVGWAACLCVTAMALGGCHVILPLAPAPPSPEAHGAVDALLTDGAGDGQQGDGVAEAGDVVLLLLETSTQNIGGLHAFDLLTRKELDTYSISLDNGGDFGMTADGSQLVLANGEEGEVQVLKVWEGKSVNFVPENMVDIGHASRQLALHPKVDTAYVQVYDQVVAVDLKTMKKGSVIWTGNDGITEIGVLSGGDRVLVGTWMTGGLHFVDPQSATTVGMVTNLGAVSTFVLTSDDAFAYCISKWNDNLYTVRLGSSPALQQTVTLSFQPFGLALTRDNRELVVHGGKSLVHYALDSSGAPKTPGNTIALSCTKKPEQDNEQLSLALSPDGKVAVAACHGEPKVAIVELAPGKESAVKTLLPGTEAVLGIMIREVGE